MKFLGPLFLVWIFVSMNAQMVLSLKMYRFLKKHFKNMSAKVRSNKSELHRLKTENSILKAVFIQGFAPILLALPILVRNIFDFYFHKTFNPREPLIFGISIAEITRLMNRLNPLVDAWAVLFVMIPCARARRKMCSNFSEALKRWCGFASNQDGMKNKNVNLFWFVSFVFHQIWLFWYEVFTVGT